MGKKYEKQTGWEPLPLSLKILFSLTALNAVLSLLSLGKAQYALFGILLSGINAMLALVVLNTLGAVVLLFAMWRRQPWGWKYGVAYFGVFALSGLVGLAQFINKPYLGFIIATALVVAINAAFMFALFRKRGYFE